jgi:hypothetical protein
MKISKLIQIIGLILLIGFSSISIAGDYGSGTLGAAPTAADKFYMICPAGTAKMVFQVIRHGAVRVQISQFSPSISPATVAVSNGVQSKQIMIPAKAGAHFFTVNKAPAVSGAVTYRPRIDCIDASGFGLGPIQTYPQVYIQNQ